MAESLFDMPRPGDQAKAVAASALEILGTIAAFGFHDSNRPELRAYVKAGREALAVADAYECDGGNLGGFFPTACGRDHLHARHPLGRPPAVGGEA